MPLYLPDHSEEGRHKGPRPSRSPTRSKKCDLESANSTSILDYKAQRVLSDSMAVRAVTLRQAAEGKESAIGRGSLNSSVTPNEAGRAEEVSATPIPSGFGVLWVTPRGEPACLSLHLLHNSDGDGTGSEMAPAPIGWQSTDELPTFHVDPESDEGNRGTQSHKWLTEFFPNGQIRSLAPQLCSTLVRLKSHKMHRL